MNVRAAEAREHVEDLGGALVFVGDEGVGFRARGERAIGAIGAVGEDFGDGAEAEGAGFGEKGAVTWASGTLATVTAVDTGYPIVSTTDALARLNDHTGKWLWFGGNPEVMRIATKYGLPRTTLMRFLLKLMANLPDKGGSSPSDRIVNALSRLAPDA